MEPVRCFLSFLNKWLATISILSTPLTDLLGAVPVLLVTVAVPLCAIPVVRSVYKDSEVWRDLINWCPPILGVCLSLAVAFALLSDEPSSNAHTNAHKNAPAEDLGRRPAATPDVADISQSSEVAVVEEPKSTRERQVEMVNDVAKRMHQTRRYDYLKERIPKIDGGMSCEEFVDLLSMIHVSIRDDLIIDVAGHLQDPDSCMSSLLDIIHITRRPDVARVLHEAIDNSD